MEPITIAEITNDLMKFNIIADTQMKNIYYNIDGKVVGGSHESMESFLTFDKKGIMSETYENYIFNLNRAWALILDLFKEGIQPSGVKQIKNQILCEACLILMVTAFETYLYEKIFSIADKLIIPHIEKSLFKVMEISNSNVKKSFQNKDLIKKMYKSIGLIILTDPKKPKPFLDKGEMFIEIDQKLWDKIFKRDQKPEKCGYMIMRHKIVHKYSISYLNSLTLHYIGNCLLDLTDLIYTFERITNEKYKDLIQFIEWDDFKVDLR